MIQDTTWEDWDLAALFVDYHFDYQDIANEFLYQNCWKELRLIKLIFNSIDLNIWQSISTFFIYISIEITHFSVIISISKQHVQKMLNIYNILYFVKLNLICFAWF